MRSRRPSPEHEEAVARRLAALVAELEATRPGAGGAYAEPVAQPFEVDAQPVEVADGSDVLDDNRDLGDLDDCESTVVRLPGRHAARRGGASVVQEDPSGGGGGWRQWVGERSTWALAPAHLAVVAALVAGGLAVTCWWLVASGPQARPVAAPVPVVEQTPGAVASGPGEPSTAVDPQAAAQVVVDVAGRVRRPGIVVLPAGARVVDALEAAGGARKGVDLKALNLARLLVDGEQVLVGVEPPGGVASGAVSSSGPEPATTLVNINQADQTLLETLPGVGPVTATAIITWRTDNGGFRAVDDLLEVSGIGEATLAKLAPLVTV